jgi:hypothetical protein
VIKESKYSHIGEYFAIIGVLKEEGLKEFFFSPHPYSKENFMIDLNRNWISRP